MSDNPSLLQQLASRCRKFHSATGIPQTSVAQAIGMHASNYNAFLQGTKGISAEATCALLKFTAMTKRNGIAKFIKPVAVSKIMLLHENGERIQLANDGWVSGEGQSADDPVASTSIDETVDATQGDPNDAIAVLRQVRSLHRKAVSLISDAINKAKANRDGTTPPTSQKFSR
jgi:hypothetical protein